MNAPIKIQIDDAAKRKADLWDALQDGELSAPDCNIIDAALSHYAEHMQREASRLDAESRKISPSGGVYLSDQARGLHYAALHTNAKAARAKDLRDKFQNGGNSYIMPGGL